MRRLPCRKLCRLWFTCGHALRWLTLPPQLWTRRTPCAGTTHCTAAFAARRVPTTVPHFCPVPSTGRLLPPTPNLFWFSLHIVIQLSAELPHFGCLPFLDGQYRGFRPLVIPASLPFIPPLPHPTTLPTSFFSFHSFTALHLRLPPTDGRTSARPSPPFILL